jgi:hypothetical protein
MGRRALLAMLLPVLAASACADRAPGQTEPEGQENARMIINPVVHFEIPVTDMDRAVAFYEDVLGYSLNRETVDGYEMAFFPRVDGRYGAAGALAKGDVYRPSHNGPVIYFDVADIDAVMARAAARGAKVLYPKKDIGEAGFVAEFEDSEGNRIALSQPRG